MFEKGAKHHCLAPFLYQMDDEKMKDLTQKETRYGAVALTIVVFLLCVLAMVYLGSKTRPQPKLVPKTSERLYTPPPLPLLKAQTKQDSGPDLSEDIKRLEKRIKVLEQKTVDQPRLLRMLCKQGIKPACYELLSVLKKPTKQDVEMSWRFFNEDCTAKKMQGCYGLAMGHTHGFVVPIDYQKANALLERACLGQHGPACYMRAKHWEVEQAPFAIDGHQSHVWAKKGCVLNHAASCYEVYLDYTNSDGVEEDDAKGAIYENKAYDLGFVEDES